MTSPARALQWAAKYNTRTVFLWWVAGCAVAAVLWMSIGATATDSGFESGTPDVRNTFRYAITATGSLNPVTTVAIGSSVSGVVQEVFCDYNMPVKKGQLCAKIDPRPYQTVVDQDRASLATAGAQLKKDRANLAYMYGRSHQYAALLAQAAVSQDQVNSLTNEYMQARAQVDLDNASVDQHEAILKAAEVYLDYTNIVSPIDGIVVARNATVGQTVVVNFQAPTLFVVSSDLSKMEIDARVAEKDIGAVRVKDRADFTVDAYPGRLFSGVVSQVRQIPQKIGNAVTYAVVIMADNREMLFKPGMTARVRIRTNPGNNLAALRD